MVLTFWEGVESLVDEGFAHREVVGCVSMGEVLEMRTFVKDS